MKVKIELLGYNNKTIGQPLLLELNDYFEEVIPAMYLNHKVIEFPQLTEDIGAAYAYAIFMGDTLIDHANFDTVKNLVKGDTARFLPGDLPFYVRKYHRPLFKEAQSEPENEKDEQRDNTDSKPGFALYKEIYSINGEDKQSKFINKRGD